MSSKMLTTRSSADNHPKPSGFYLFFPPSDGASALGEQCSAKLTISNKYGMHARPATDFAQGAMGFQSEIRVIAGPEKADGKSVMELMMLAATKGTEIEVICNGDDAKEALDHLASLVKRGFDEEE